MSDMAKKLSAEVIKKMTKAGLITQTKLAYACGIEPGQLSKFIKHSGPLALEKQEALVNELERVLTEADEVPFDREEMKETLVKIRHDIRVPTSTMKVNPRLEVSGTGSVEYDQLSWLASAAQKLVKMGFKVHLHFEAEVRSPELGTEKEKD